jgi:hypothetical protein
VWTAVEPPLMGLRAFPRILREASDACLAMEAHPQSSDTFVQFADFEAAVNEHLPEVLGW